MQGILMTPANIKATRDKLKTQTRRLDHLKEINKEPDLWKSTGVVYAGGEIEFYRLDSSRYLLIKPRYRVGETAYIKEAYEFYRRIGTQANIKYIRDSLVTWVYIPKDKPTPKIGYHSPLFLPEWAARDFIKITEVRPERLQDITARDCEAEGVTFKHPHAYDVDSGMSMPEENKRNWLRIAYMELWDSINGKPIRSKEWTETYDYANGGIPHKHYVTLPNPYRWDANCWVWAYTYELLDRNNP